MSNIRPKRKSCEACRARKLKCSGKHSGCSRCVHLGLVCKFNDKGMPGRPRKWSIVDSLENNHQASSNHQGQLDITQSSEIRDERGPFVTSPETLERHRTPSTSYAEGSSIGSTDLLSVLSEDWFSNKSDDLVFDHDQGGAFPLLDFNTSEQLDTLPLDPFRACLSNETCERGSTQLTLAVPTPPAGPQQSCDCAKRVFEVLRSLKSGPISHSTVHILRLGAELLEKLLRCPLCYDVSKPPRITLQNVLLLGRLFLGVTTGYQEYLQWVRNYCNVLAGRKMSDTVYLSPEADVGQMLGFEISSEKLYEVIAHGLRSDAKRLSDLGRQFAVRQHNRHLIGHEACPDLEGRCWKEKDEVDPDPSDVCPQSVAARALTPCYRIVDEVRSHVKRLEDAIT